MARDGINIRVEVDLKTNAALSEWAKRDERSKRSLARKILRSTTRKWMEKRAQGEYRN